MIIVLIFVVILHFPISIYDRNQRRSPRAAAVELQITNEEKKRIKEEKEYISRQKNLLKDSQRSFGLL